MNFLLLSLMHAVHQGWRCQAPCQLSQSSTFDANFRLHLQRGTLQQSDRFAKDTQTAHLPINGKFQTRQAHPESRVQTPYLYSCVLLLMSIALISVNMAVLLHRLVTGQSSGPKDASTERFHRSMGVDMEPDMIGLSVARTPFTNH